MQGPQDPDQFAKLTFIITTVGAVAYIGAVLAFVL